MKTTQCQGHSFVMLYQTIETTSSSFFCLPNSHIKSTSTGSRQWPFSTMNVRRFGIHKCVGWPRKLATRPSLESLVSLWHLSAMHSSRMSGVDKTDAFRPVSDPFLATTTCEVNYHTSRHEPNTKPCNFRMTHGRRTSTQHARVRSDTTQGATCQLLATWQR